MAFSLSENESFTSLFSAISFRWVLIKEVKIASLQDTTPCTQKKNEIMTRKIAFIGLNKIGHLFSLTMRRRRTHSKKIKEIS